MDTFHAFFMFYSKSTSTSVVSENAATLFCCEDPEMFCVDLKT